MATASHLGSFWGVFYTQRGVWSLGGYPRGVKKGGFYPLYGPQEQGPKLPLAPPLLSYRGLILGPFGTTIASALLSLRSLEYGHPRVHHPPLGRRASEQKRRRSRLLRQSVFPLRSSFLFLFESLFLALFLRGFPSSLCSTPLEAGSEIASANRRAA